MVLTSITLKETMLINMEKKVRGRAGKEMENMGRCTVICRALIIPHKNCRDPDLSIMKEMTYRMMFMARLPYITEFNTCSTPPSSAYMAPKVPSSNCWGISVTVGSSVGKGTFVSNARIFVLFKKVTSIASKLY